MERFLKSRYRIGDKIGENPFSFTYKGYLMGTEVPIIIKIYKRSALNSPLINKLRPKVTKMISLDHPNIARVIDGDYGWQGFFYVREYIEGENLEELFLKGVPEIEVSIEIMRQILEPLVVAHDAEIIHGAINSRNIFITVGKELKLTDFIMEPDVRVNPTLLAAAAVNDSVYMSPEQISGEELSKVSDIYSAGIIFYQLLTGLTPFNGSQGLDSALSHLSEEIVLPSNYNDRIPEYIDNIVMKMLERNPMQRFGSVRDVLESITNQHVSFKLPNQDLLNLIYNDESEPLVYEEEQPKKQKQEKPKIFISKKRKRRNKLLIVFLMILIAIASGLWYAFILSLLATR